jgi:hypothetical protein
VNDLLREEEQLGLGLRSPQRLKQGEDAPKCLEHLIRDGGKLKPLCSKSSLQPPEVKLVVMQALSEMFSNVRHPHFWGSQAVQIPLAGFLQGCLDKEAVGEGQEDLVLLLGSVCDKLRSCEAELLPFFFNEAAADGEEPFLVFTIILQYMHDTRERVHETVRRSMLACVQLEDPAVANFIATTAFASELSAEAARQFNWVLEDGGGDSSLFRVLEHCNHVASSCDSQALCSKLSEALATDFAQAMQDGLHNPDPEYCVNATCLVRAVVVSLKKEEMWEEDWRRAEDDVHGLGNVEAVHRETHAAILGPIVTALMDPRLIAGVAARIDGRDGADEELALESIKLVASLLDLFEEGVYNSLVLSAVPAGTMASDEQEFLAALDLHPCLLQHGSTLEEALDAEAFWARRVWQSKAGGAAVGGLSPRAVGRNVKQAAGPDSPAACVQALLNVLSRFHSNSMAVNVAATAALRSIASYPHAELERYLFDVSGGAGTGAGAGADGTAGGLGSVLAVLSAELTEREAGLLSSWEDGNGALAEQLASLEQSLIAGGTTDTADAVLLRVLVLRSFVAQLAAALRARCGA